MKKLLLILLCVPLIFISCQQNNPTPPCDGNCGNIVGFESDACFGLVSNGNGGLIQTEVCKLIRIENECSGEIATFHFNGSDYNDVKNTSIGDQICYYQ